MILYHGTTSKRLEQILKEGLVPNRHSNWEIQSKEGFIYLTDTYPGYFAITALGDDESEKDTPVILELEVNEDNLYPDEDFVAQVNHRHDNSELTLNELTEQVDLELYGHCWRESLALFGNVAHKGKIPAASLQRHTEVSRELYMDWMNPSISLMNHYVCSEFYKDLIKATFGDLDKGLYMNGDYTLRSIQANEDARAELGI